MEFNFTGNHRAQRNINLGGSRPTGPSAGQLAASARAERAERQAARAQNLAATRIQAAVRGRAEAGRTRAAFAQQFDELADAGALKAEQARNEDVQALLAATRLLVFALPPRELRKADNARLVRWCAALNTSCSSSSPSALLFRPLASALSTDDQRASWILFLRLLARRCVAQLGRALGNTAVPSPSANGRLSAASADFTTPVREAQAYLSLLSALLSSKDQVPVLASQPRTRTQASSSVLPDSGGQGTLGQYFGALLVGAGLHAALRSHLLALPVDRKSSTTLALSITLALAPFRVFPSAPFSSPANGSASTNSAQTPSPRAQAVRTFVSDVLTIPLLPNRIPLSSLTELTVQLPFEEVVSFVYALGSTPITTSSHRPLRSPHLLANLLALGARRVPHLSTGAALASYLAALTTIQNVLPTSVFISADEYETGGASARKGAASTQVEMSHDDEDEAYEEASSNTGSKAIAISSMSANTGKHPASSSSPARDANSSSEVVDDYVLPLDAQTYKWLSILPSPSHLSSILAASARFSSSTRPALCAFLCATLSAWPGPTRERLLSAVMYGYIANPSAPTGKGDAAEKVQAPRGAAGSTVGGLVREVWRGWVRGSALARKLASAGTGGKESLGVLNDASLANEWPALVLLCELYSRCLLTIGDDEFYPPKNSFDAPTGPGGSGVATSRNPLTLDEVVSLSALLRNLAFAMYWHEGAGALGDLQPKQEREGVDKAAEERTVPGMRLGLLGLRNLVTKILQQIHARDSRWPFAPEGHWLMVSQLDLQTFIQTVVLEEQELASSPADEQSSDAMDVDQNTREDGDSQDGEDDNESSAVVPALPVSSRVRARAGRAHGLSARTLAFLSPRLGVLNNIPFVIPFDVRVEIFRQFIRNDAHKLGIDRNMFSRRHRHRVYVRRGHIAEDGFTKLYGLGAGLKETIEIVFIDQWGHEEAGIDGGGVFKEFLTSLVREAFDSDRGLWRATDDQQLYPNPHSYAAQPEQLAWYTFLGRVLGKALYEGILVDINFAGFFLSKWLGKQSYLDDLASLDSLDRELYRGLIYLKNYPGDVEADLALNFTVTDDEFGERKTTELVPGGSNIPVTRENRLQYIYRVSHYRLSAQISRQCDAFFAGLSDLIDPRWLRMLNREELRVLVSGTGDPIDLEDLRANTVYGGFHEKDLTVEYFWNTLETFDQPTRKAFLKFVTSCPSPPLLGFSQLNPKFAIRNAGDDETRLPTASTCVNLLKLPRYTSLQQCAEKLRYAIQSGAGFDLS